MKRILFLLIVLASYAGLTAGCNWLFPEENNDGTVPENVNFYTGCPLTFYYADENGASPINIETPDTYPVAFRGAVPESTCEIARANVQVYEKDGEVLYVYNGGSNSLLWSEEDQLYGFQTWFYGVTPQVTYSFPIYIGNDIDTLKVGYKYLTTADDVQISGASWAVDVESVTYNGVEVLVGNINGKVFIEKPSQGETVVRIGSL